MSEQDNFNDQQDNNYYWNANDYSNNDNQKKPKKKHGKTIFAVVLTVAVVGSGVAIAWNGQNSIFKNASTISTDASASNNSNSDKTVEKVTLSTDSSTSSSSSNSGVTITDVSDVVTACMPSVVAITSQTIVDSGNYGPWGSWNSNGNEQSVQEGAGSGIIIAKTSEELLVLTNNHVVEGASKLSVQFCDEKSVEASVKGTDSSSDLAVVAIPLSKIKTSTLNEIKIAKLGSSDDLKVGQGVIAIGNALGYGQSVTSGIISALDREVQSSDGTSKKMIQIDAAINGGNSGGALINSKGEVIGINAAKYSSSGSSTSASVEGMGFAIPVSSSTDIINNLMNQKTRTKVDEDKRGALGITCQEISSAQAKAYGIPEGVMVADVTKNGAADKAGISQYDVITAVEGNKVTSYDELKEQLAYYAVGDKVKVTIQVRDGKEYTSKDVTVTLQKQQSSGSTNKSNSGSDSGSDSNSNSDSGSSSDGDINDFINGFFNQN